MTSWEERWNRKLPPVEELHYELRPSFVSSLTWAHHSAGRVAGMRFSHYGLKRLQADAGKRRITSMVSRSGVRGAPFVTPDDVMHVVAGGLLPPRKRPTMDLIRRAAVLCEGARHFGSRGDATTPETVVTYSDFNDGTNALWTKFVGQRKEKLLEIHRDSVEVPEDLRALYDWMNADELVVDEPILRAALLNWGLSLLYTMPADRMVIDAVIDQELRAGFIDSRGLLVLADSQAGELLMRRDRYFDTRPVVDGGLNSLFEEHALCVARALDELRERLLSYQDKEERLPWLMVRPPDELDRQIYDIIEQLGAARCKQIHEELSDPPPLRTLQRRLQRLAQDGLVSKLGGRKDAYYRIAEHM